MKKYKCKICGYIHDEQDKGSFSDLDDSYVCPICGAPKNLFIEEQEQVKPEEEVKEILPESADDTKELNNLEISVICSNLAKGCEKQYLTEESKLFNELSEYFNPKKTTENVDETTLMNLINKDLETNLKEAKESATKHNDRGALRALTWSGKVTNILKILLNKYYNEDLSDTKVYVCTICGFVFIGNELPNVCPICKVPNYKFIEVEEN